MSVFDKLFKRKKTDKMKEQKNTESLMFSQLVAIYVNIQAPNYRNMYFKSLLV